MRSHTLPALVSLDIFLLNIVVLFVLSRHLHILYHVVIDTVYIVVSM